MAESKGTKRYGHGPHIADKGSKSQGTEHTDETPTRETKGAAPKGSELSGTERQHGGDRVPQEPSAPDRGDEEKSATMHEVPTHERHFAERKEMHGRHHSELSAMHERHADENKKMNSRHEKELAGEGAKEEAA